MDDIHIETVLDKLAHAYQIFFPREEQQIQFVIHSVIWLRENIEKRFDFLSRGAVDENDAAALRLKQLPDLTPKWKTLIMDSNPCTSLKSQRCDCELYRSISMNCLLGVSWIRKHFLKRNLFQIFEVVYKNLVAFCLIQGDSVKIPIAVSWFLSDISRHLCFSVTFNYAHIVYSHLLCFILS